MKILSCICLLTAALYTEACANNPRAATASDKPVPGKDTVVVAAPAAARPDSFAVGKVIDTVICSTDATQSYAVYIPATGNKKAWPVIYFFDPHASGSLPLNKYKALANKYGFLLIGSNNSKNGNDWQLTDAIWQILASDTRTRFRIDAQRMYTVGFSGGAKVAGYVALNHPEIKGVIANGAGLPDGVNAGNYAFSFTALTGEGDMNMTELVAVSAAFDKTNTRHRLIVFNGKHEWAPEKTMDVALTGLQFDAMLNKQLPMNEALIKAFAANSKKAVETYSSSNNLVKAVAECTLANNLLQGLSSEAGWFTNKAALLTGQAAYKQQALAQEQLLQKEEQIKAQYMQQLQQGDMNYWTKEIAGLQAKAKANTAEGAMYQRLLAYLSLAFYSFSNQLVGNHRDVGAEYFVNLYKMADPTNSEAWFFSAILHARSNDMAATEADLLKAVACGFNDKARLRQQNDFVGRPIDFAKIERGMK
jgi:pimeloyl-ACP methyl ester carboxylesterase